MGPGTSVPKTPDRHAIYYIICGPQESWKGVQFRGQQVAPPDGRYESEFSVSSVL
jgi:hypothetical protein